jgi:hypothetical protein
MKDLHFVAVALIVVQAAPVLAQEKVGPGPAEKAAKRLAELLEPGAAKEVPFASKPLPRRGSWWIEHPQAPLPVFQGTPPLLPPAPLQTAPPPHPREEAPLAGYRSEPPAPFAVALPEGSLVRLPAVDVNQPLPLPILAQPQRDRASLADPTYETSIAFALAQVQAIRIGPVPFVPINLPDPFENSQAVRLRFVLEEHPLPPLVTPRPPVK